MSLEFAGQLSAQPFLLFAETRGSGGWTVAQSNLGFPAGRKKTVLFNLKDVFRPDTPRRVRLRTNLEIYWDQIEWAQGMPEAPLKMQPLAPMATDLHYRGYSVIHRPDAGAPEVPDYNTLFSTKQIWRDLVGYYTRFGEVSALLWRDYDPTMKPLGRLQATASFDSKRKRLKSTKTGVSRQIPVHPLLAKLLAEWKLGGFERAGGAVIAGVGVAWCRLRASGLRVERWRPARGAVVNRAPKIGMSKPASAAEPRSSE